MRFVIALALFCCCYAAEQSTPAVQQEGRLPPQHIKEFVEQHIKRIKQQIPLLHQQLKGEVKIRIEKQKPKIHVQQLPENIENFIKAHITKVMHYALQQKQNKPVESQSTLAVPSFVLKNIEKLREDIRYIMKQAEIQITQAINQQIKLTDKPQNVEKTVVNLIKEKEVTPVEVDKKIGPENTIPIQNVVEIIQQHQLQHVAKDQKKVVPEVLTNAKDDVQQHVEQNYKHEHDNVQDFTQPHLAQMLNLHVANVAEKANHVPTIYEQILHQIPQVAQQTAGLVPEENAKETLLVPNNLQSVVQHIPQVEKKNDKATPVVATTGQDVIKQSVAQNDNSVVPSNIADVVQQIHNIIPQVIITHDEDHVAQALNNIVIPA